MRIGGEGLIMLESNPFVTNACHPFETVQNCGFESRQSNLKGHHAKVDRQG